MTVIRSRTVAGQAVRLANPAVDRSLRAWEARVEEAEQRAYDRARQELQAEFNQRIVDAEAAAQTAEDSVNQRISDLEAEHQAQWGQLLASLSAVSQELQHLRAETVGAAEGEVVRLALAIAGRILQRQLDENESWLADVLQPALSDLPARHGVSLRLHPEDAAHAQAQLETALQQISQPPAMPTIIPDAVLVRGSVRVECAGTVVDASLPHAWQRVSEHLLAQAPEQDVSITLSAPPVADPQGASTDAEPAGPAAVEQAAAEDSDRPAQDGAES